MPSRNRQVVIVAATIVAMIAAILVAANIEAVDHKCAWQFPSIASCLLSARETLAAGLIGTGGAVFAGWLAYSAAQESAAQALKSPCCQTRRTFGTGNNLRDRNRKTETCCGVSRNIRK
jgi:hypothetical protein